ncbi:MAG: GNAT family N-acetyltransferase [Flavobacteriales bacterium]|nr:GNAT family N-acetyltransferase [Flavobacteriales bacterium]
MRPFPVLELDLTPFPELRTERLILRAIAPDDGAALFRIRADKRVMHHIGRPLATTEQDALDLIDRALKDQAGNNAISWAITMKDDPTLIGTIGYYRLKKEHYRGEVGYALHSDHWRKGIMKEALLAVVACGFERLGFHSIEADTDPRNTASNALLRSCGFVREGLFKENFFWNGEFLDSAVYSLLKADFMG